MPRASIAAADVLLVVVAGKVCCGDKIQMDGQLRMSILVHDTQHPNNINGTERNKNPTPIIIRFDSVVNPF